MLAILMYFNDILFNYTHLRRHGAQHTLRGACLFSFIVVAEFVIKFKGILSITASPQPPPSLSLIHHPVFLFCLILIKLTLHCSSISLLSPASLFHQNIFFHLLLYLSSPSPLLSQTFLPPLFLLSASC